MSMKSQNITELSEAEFIYELIRDGSRVNNNPIQWTHEWLNARGASVKGLKGLGDWSGAATSADRRLERKNDIIGCINAVIAAQRSSAAARTAKRIAKSEK